MRRVALLAAISLLALGTGCAPATGSSSGSADAPRDGRTIAAVHLSQCGNCHTPVEPGTRARAELEAALGRHRRRLRLSSTEWSEMLEYLSANAGLKSAKATTESAAR